MPETIVTEEVVDDAVETTEVETVEPLAVAEEPEATNEVVEEATVVEEAVEAVAEEPEPILPEIKPLTIGDLKEGHFYTLYGDEARFSGCFRKAANGKVSLSKNDESAEIEHTITFKKYTVEEISRERAFELNVLAEMQ